jgi:hypothetical protein
MSTHRDDTATAAGRLRLALDKHDTDRFNLPINIGIAVASLGLSIVLGLLLPLPIYKVIIGVAFVVAVVTVGMLVHRRFFKTETPAVEEVPDGR